MKKIGICIIIIGILMLTVAMITSFNSYLTKKENIEIAENIIISSDKESKNKLKFIEIDSDGYYIFESKNKCHYIVDIKSKNYNVTRKGSMKGIE